MDRIEEIRARLEAATPGPWKTGGSAACGDVYFGTLVDPDDPTEPGVMLGMTSQAADAALIAHAPADIAWLLEQLAGARGVA